jgi:hypothetical protein
MFTSRAGNHNFSPSRGGKHNLSLRTLNETYVESKN